MTHKYNTACRQCLSLMHCARMPCYIRGPWPLPPLAVVTWVDDLGQVEPHPPGTVMHEPPTPLWIWCDRWERQWGALACSLVNFRLGTFAYKSSLGNFSLGTLAWPGRNHPPTPIYIRMAKLYIYYMYISVLAQVQLQARVKNPIPLTLPNVNFTHLYSHVRDGSRRRTLDAKTMCH